MVHLQKIAQFFNQIDIGELSQLEKQIGKLLEQEGYLVKEEIPYGVGEGESYWVYSVPEKRTDGGLTLEEIKEAVLSGKTVHWQSENYFVKRDRIGEWYIICANNDTCIGLTHLDGVTMNGGREEFFLG